MEAQCAEDLDHLPVDHHLSLSLLGTFMVRSAFSTSVHSFASDPTRGLVILSMLRRASSAALSAGSGFRGYALRALAVRADRRVKAP